jgi:serine/threonine protein kinase
MPARYSYELRQTVATMLRKNPEDRPSAEALLRKRLFSIKQTHQSVTKRKLVISSINRKAFGSLSVYATPLTRPAKGTFVKSKSQIVKTKKDPRRRWNPPTQTLIGALSSLTLTDATSTYTLTNDRSWSLDHLSENTYDESDESQQSVDSDILCCINDRNTIVRTSDETQYHRLERWMVSLEAVHGVKLLKDGR